ncbi:maker738 [Drosophila busckii]|uniref:Maker738 n=1 Tax=Drosophila busckii TaxID=30019 RepID=A0A0M5IZ15_DROBS|nr:uncharacterized protein LOC108599302 [Drosophila busckii]ALC44581.1 maker738 [Drosophila busckii]
MKFLIVIATLLAVSQAVELEKPEQQQQLPAHIQMLITNHVNQILQQLPKPIGATTITGHVPQLARDLLPPHVQQPVVMPPVSAVVSMPQIPHIVNQAIKESHKLQAQVASSSTHAPVGKKQARLLDSDAPLMELTEHQRELVQRGKCNFECPQQALPVCASNDKCVVEFAGQCELSQWNCFNTKNVFHQVHDDECRHATRCYDQDMQ